MRAALSSLRAAPLRVAHRRRSIAPAAGVSGPLHLLRFEETEDGGIMFSFGDAPPAPSSAAVPAPEAARVFEEEAAPAAPPVIVAPSSGGRSAATVAAASAASAPGAPHSKADLATLKVVDLKKLAAEAGVKGASKLKKAELVEALLLGGQ